MTYVIGQKKFGYSTIISDARVTQGHDGQNTSLKSGFLFSGCIYGASGNVIDVRKFIRQCREDVGNEGNLGTIWEKFNEFVYSYNKENHGDFKIIISSRHGGKPELFLIDSAKLELEPVQDFLTLGSAPQIIHNYSKKLFNEQRHANIKVSLKSCNAPLWFYAYFDCTYLMEWVQGHSASALEKAGVGGCFHFLWQGDEEEHRQGPSIYVISEKHESIKTFVCHIFRVDFVDNTLIFENPVIAETSIITNTTEMPALEGLSQNELDIYFKGIIKKSSKRIPYEFCGFGFENPSRGMNGFHIPEGDQYFFDLEGNLLRPDDDLKRLLSAMFER